MTHGDRGRVGSRKFTSRACRVLDCAMSGHRDVQRRRAWIGGCWMSTTPDKCETRYAKPGMDFGSKVGFPGHLRRGKREKGNRLAVCVRGNADRAESGDGKRPPPDTRESTCVHACTTSCINSMQRSYLFGYQQERWFLNTPHAAATFALFWSVFFDLFFFFFVDAS